jgi:hypothetical protein
VAAGLLGDGATETRVRAEGGPGGGEPQEAVARDREAGRDGRTDGERKGGGRRASERASERERERRLRAARVMVAGTARRCNPAWCRGHVGVCLQLLLCCVAVAAPGHVVVGKARSYRRSVVW